MNWISQLAAQKQIERGEMSEQEWRLTDEEIQQAYSQSRANSWRHIAETQVRKLEEWRNHHCSDPQHAGWGGARWTCPDCRKVLREELYPKAT